MSTDYEESMIIFSSGAKWLVSACAIHLEVATISGNDECHPHSQQLC